MRERARRVRSANVAAVGMAVMLGLGAIVLYLTVLSGRGELPAGIPAPSALDQITRFVVPGHGQACMNLVSVSPQSRLASFALYPARGAAHGGPPVDLALDAPGYHATISLAGGYPGGVATLPLARPPAHAVLTTACFHNRGRRSVQFAGTDEPRTVSRSDPAVIDGQATPGDIALTFYDEPGTGLRYGVSRTISHASNLTDGLLPPALIWILAVVTFLGLPLAFIAAWRLAVDDESGDQAAAAATDSRPRTAPSD